ncbi:hypothetical protein C2E25_02025 [Geothermobacter hydrogeniphilus]|uniref:LysM domain-containing protein n=1 Tax=Geothermobacter hydrogeniphilus TaxID=1969733 RepID=A0A2K2HDI2_9BACT|nr:LysM domain-containing protein [Geothermobacter hydrogeniphilus]PNU21355.1 hypothetical protein C2E25_02025 [Geothermobacter hydrogeniphilus]
MKKSLLLILSLLLLLPALAAAGGSPATRTYVIKKGDTLWGISQRFIKDPYYWPNLWSNNPFITNPHLIYPGQKVAIYDGRIELVPEFPEPDKPATQPAAKKETPAEPTAATPQANQPLPEVQETITIRTMGGAEGFVGLDQIDNAGTLIDATDNRLLMAAGDTVFCDMKNLADTHPGDTFSLVEVGKEVLHPITGEPVGRQIAETGALEVISVNNSVATARIISSNREIHRSNLLIPFSAPLLEVELKRSDKPIEGVIISAKENKIGIGQHDIIYLDLGTADGLQIGNMVNISRKRKPSEFIVKKTEVELPDVLLGAAVVLTTEEHTSSALVLKSVETLLRGDKVTTVTE